MRDYGTAQWDGGDPECDHIERVMKPSQRSTLEDHGSDGRSPQLDALPGIPYRSVCGKCGATRIDRQLGLEPTLAEYIASMVAVFREVRRVLRDDGTLWLNIGDSYASTGGVHSSGSCDGGVGVGAGTGVARYSGDLKPKDLMMVPARLALALQDDGWYLRSDIIWHKPNPMPESVTDRPTSAHEHIFLLTKRSRYYYDADAIREQGAEPERQRFDRIGGANGHTVRHSEGGMIGASADRNCRNVWTIATKPFSEAHFATFPPEIPTRCIKAGTSEKGQCPDCGAPWVRVAESHIEYSQRVHNGTKYGGEGQFGHMAANRHRDGHIPGRKVSMTTGWQPSCTCDAGEPVPQTVLDPFLGSGTTLLVADRLGRHGVGIELNPEYAQMARKRITNDAPLFAQVAV